MAFFTGGVIETDYKIRLRCTKKSCGDVKLMAACGLILGWKLIILAFLLGCIIGSVVHMIRIKVSGVSHMLAMGPYLSAGIFLAALWGNSWISWYIGLLGL